MKNTLNNLIENFTLLHQSPKDFLYSFTYSNKNKVHISEFDERTEKIAKKIIEDIKRISIKLNPHFVGSSALRIVGQGDIDIIVECPYKEFDLYMPLLIKSFGKPIKKRSKFAQWKFRKENYEIDLTMVDKNSYMYKNSVVIFNLLKNNNNLLNEYVELKNSLDDKPIRVYVRKRMLFFNNVFRKNHL